MEKICHVLLVPEIASDGIGDLICNNELLTFVKSCLAQLKLPIIFGCRWELSLYLVDHVYKDKLSSRA